MSRQDYVEEILRQFDFKKVHKVMTVLDWTWGDHERVPTVGELRDCARELLTCCLKQGKGFSCTGGFWAILDEDGELTLQFVLEEWSVATS